MDPITIGLTLAAKYAPDLIKYFGGSETSATVAGKVIDIAQTVTGSGTPGDAAAALAVDPVAAQAFREACAQREHEFDVALLADRSSARTMQVAALAQEDLFSKRFIYYFAAAWSLFSMVYMLAVTFYPAFDETGKANSSTILGFLLGTAVSGIFSFFYGSTKGSWDKTKLLAQKDGAK